MGKIKQTRIRKITYRKSQTTGKKGHRRCKTCGKFI